MIRRNMQKLDEMQYLAGVINQDHFYSNGYDKVAIKKITRRINRIIENINYTLENAEEPTSDDTNKQAASASSFFEKLKSSLGTPTNNSLLKKSPAEIENLGNLAESKVEEFKRNFEQNYPEAAAKLKKEALSDAGFLKAELPLTTEGILGMLGKGAALIGGGLLWAAWKVIKFILLTILKVIIKIAKNIFTAHGKGVLPFVTICFAIIFPWLGFVKEPIFLIPAGIYYMVMTIGALMKVGEHK